MQDNRIIHPGLYAITPAQLKYSMQLIHQITAVIEGGARYLQYRDKSNTYQEKEHMARALMRLCYDYGVPLIINDNIEIAKAVGADGVHLGKADINIHEARKYLGHHAIIGASCYGDLRMAKNAISAGANYVAFGSFFRSITKPQASIIKPEILHYAKKYFKVPICAIGGITIENASQVIKQGADWIAVTSGIFNQPDPYHTAEQFAKLFQDRPKCSSPFK